MSRERVRGAFHRIRRWEPGEWLALVPAGALVARIEVGLRTTSVAALGDRLGVRFDSEAFARTGPTAAGPPPFTDDERRRLRAVTRVLRYWPFGDTCLRQCLASGSVLRDRRPRLVIGVARAGSTLAAHSWLELADGSLDPLTSPTYQPLARAAAGDGAPAAAREDQPTRRP